MKPKSIDQYVNKTMWSGAVPGPELSQVRTTGPRMFQVGLPAAGRSVCASCSVCVAPLSLCGRTCCRVDTGNQKQEPQNYFLQTQRDACVCV